MPTYVRPQHPAEDDPARLIEQHWNAVYRICVARLSRREDAEDAAQETFIQFLRADRTQIVSVPGWLTVVAVRVCARALRRRYRSLEDLTESPECSGGSDSLDEVLDVASFREVTDRLAPVDQKILNSLYLRELSLQQVATELGVTVGHLRVMAYRARRRAQRAIESQDGAPGL